MSKENEVLNVVNSTPAALENFEVGQLKSALIYISERLRRNLNDSNRKDFEEQYCYIIRELEVRKAN
jgi:hypothetical protein